MLNLADPAALHQLLAPLHPIGLTLWLLRRDNTASIDELAQLGGFCLVAFVICWKDDLLDAELDEEGLWHIPISVTVEARQSYAHFCIREDVCLDELRYTQLAVDRVDIGDADSLYAVFDSEVESHAHRTFEYVLVLE